MTLDRLFKLSVVFIATVIAAMLLLSALAVVLATWGGISGPDVVKARQVPPQPHRVPSSQR